jgi:hypothetical protein
MTQPNKREQLAAMRLEDFKAHLRTIVGGKRERITGARPSHPMLVRKKRTTRRKRRT